MAGCTVAEGIACVVLNERTIWKLVTAIKNEHITQQLWGVMSSDITVPTRTSRGFNDLSLLPSFSA